LSKLTQTHSKKRVALSKVLSRQIFLCVILSIYFYNYFINLLALLGLRLALFSNKTQTFNCRILSIKQQNSIGKSRKGKLRRGFEPGSSAPQALHAITIFTPKSFRNQDCLLLSTRSGSLFELFRPMSVQCHLGCYVAMSTSEISTGKMSI
jgi:hypothetical protein